MIQNITERKEIEAALRNSEEKFKSILATVPDLMMVLDDKGYYRDIFTAEHELLYAPAEQLLDRTIHEVLPEADARVIQGVIDKTLAENVLQEIEYPLQTPDRLRWFSARVVRFGLADNPTVL